jgi:hypothetical protein
LLHPVSSLTTYIPKIFSKTSSHLCLCLLNDLSKSSINSGKNCNILKLCTGICNFGLKKISNLPKSTGWASAGILINWSLKLNLQIDFH